MNYNYKRNNKLSSNIIKNLKKSIVYIDYDNVWITCKNKYGIDIFEKNFIDKIKAFCIYNNYSVNEIIAYGNFDNYIMSKDNHQTKLQINGIQTRHVMNGKDSADIAIVCDALEKLYLTNRSIEVYIIISCDRDITSLINKIKSQGKEVCLITLAVNIDWDVMKNYGDKHFWFESIINIQFEIPKAKSILDSKKFIEELEKEIVERGTDIKYSLWCKTLLKNYSISQSELDNIRDELISKNLIELYQYEFQNKKFYDGIKIIK